jgi:excisionase family DNA binding protein
MATSKLHQYDCDLSEYVLDNIRQYLSPENKRSGEVARQDSRTLEATDFSRWFASQSRGELAALAERIWAGLDGEPDRLPITDDDLFGLQSRLRDLPMPLERRCHWVPYEPLHGRYVKCVAEIRGSLTPRTAEEWAEISLDCASKLSKEELPLAEGVAVVREWLRHARRFQQAMSGDPEPKSKGETHLGRTKRKVQAPPDEMPIASSGGGSGHSANRSTAGDESVCGWKDAMEMTGLKKTKLYTLFNKGVLRGYRDGSMIRFYRSALTNYMKDRENTPGKKGPLPQSRRRKSKTPARPQIKFL